MIRVGGPPAEARYVRSRTARRAPAPDITDHRVVVRSWWDNRRAARLVHVYELGGRWHVLVTNGLGDQLGPTLPALPDIGAARRVARTAWQLLRGTEEVS